MQEIHTPSLGRLLVVRPSADQGSGLTTPDLPFLFSRNPLNRDIDAANGSILKAFAEAGAESSAVEAIREGGKP